MSWARLVATFVVHSTMIALVVIVSTPCFRSCFVSFCSEKIKTGCGFILALCFSLSLHVCFSVFGQILFEKLEFVFFSFLDLRYGFSGSVHLCVVLLGASHNLDSTRIDLPDVAQKG
jgi:hypothetical protein